MAASSTDTRFARLVLACVLLALGASCSTGDGEGSVTGVVHVPSCELEHEEFDLRPNVFTADPTNDFVELRIQRGSTPEDLSNRITIFVPNAAEVKASMLGVPLEVGDQLDSPIRMTLALHEICPRTRWSTPVTLVATSGEITFTSLYFPGGPNEPLTEATFTVHFEDRSRPGGPYADLSGQFSFIFSRGRPAQYFP